MKHYQTAAAIAASLLLAGLTLAQQNQANRIKGSDQTFATKAAQAGLFEVEMGRVALQKAENPQVKTFAQRMIDDHTKANDQLKSIAANQGITLPTTLDGKDQAAKDRLDKESGAKFDKAYMENQVADHKTVISEFQKEADNGTDPQLKTFAANTLPILQEHLRLAQEALNSVNSTGK